MATGSDQLIQATIRSPVADRDVSSGISYPGPDRPW